VHFSDQSASDAEEEIVVSKDACKIDVYAAAIGK
jgi:hypothetical protein